MGINTNRKIEDYILESRDKALEKLLHTNPLEASLLTVEIIFKVALGDGGISDKAKKEIELLYKQYKFYHSYLEI